MVVNVLGGIVKLVLSDHVLVGQKKWSLYRNGLLKVGQNLCYDCCWDMTKWSLQIDGLLGGHKDRFHCIYIM